MPSGVLKAGEEVNEPAGNVSSLIEALGDLAASGGPSGVLLERESHHLPEGERAEVASAVQELTDRLATVLEQVLPDREIARPAGRTH